MFGFLNDNLSNDYSNNDYNDYDYNGYNSDSNDESDHEYQDHSHGNKFFVDLNTRNKSADLNKSYTPSSSTLEVIKELGLSIPSNFSKPDASPQNDHQKESISYDTVAAIKELGLSISSNSTELIKSDKNLIPGDAPSSPKTEISKDDSYVSSENKMLFTDVSEEMATSSNQIAPIESRLIIYSQIIIPPMPVVVSEENNPSSAKIVVIDESNEAEASAAAIIPATVAIVHEEEKTRLALLSDKVYAIALKIYAYIKEAFFTNGVEFLNFVWPYATDTEHEAGMSFLEEVLASASEQLDGPEENVVKESPLDYNLSPVLTTVIGTANLITNHLILPLSFANSGDASMKGFGSAIRTAAHSHEYFNQLVGSSGEDLPYEFRSFLYQYDLISDLDAIDLALYQGAISFTAEAICLNAEALASGTPHQIMKVAVVAIANFPPAQKAIKRTKLFQRCSLLIHETTSYVREKTINVVAAPIEKFIDYKVSKWLKERMKNPDAPPLLNVEMDLSAITNPINQISSILPDAINDMAQAVIHKEVTQRLGAGLATCYKMTARSISTMIVDSVVYEAVTKVEASLFNQTVLTVFPKHPLLGSAIFFLRGGTNQTVGSVTLRVAELALLCYTGSPFITSLVFSAPDAISYIWKLRKIAKARSDKRKLQKLQNNNPVADPIDQVTAKINSALTVWFPAKFQEIKNAFGSTEFVPLPAGNRVAQALKLTALVNARKASIQSEFNVEFEGS